MLQEHLLFYDRTISVFLNYFFCISLFQKPQDIETWFDLYVSRGNVIFPSKKLVFIVSKKISFIYNYSLKNKFEDDEPKRWSTTSWKCLIMSVIFCMFHVFSWMFRSTQQKQLKMELKEASFITICITSILRVSLTSVLQRMNGLNKGWITSMLRIQKHGNKDTFLGEL